MIIIDDCLIKWAQMEIVFGPLRWRSQMAGAGLFHLSEVVLCFYIQYYNTCCALMERNKSFKANRKLF